MIDLHIQKIGESWCGVALDDEDIFATTFADSEKAVSENLLAELPYNKPFRTAEKRSDLAKEILRTIKAICDGDDVSFSFEFAMKRLSKYAQSVLRLTSLIPTGYVTNYGALAKVAGGSPRSVGRVMATNPFAPLIPCHRVVAADMTLGGYGGGLETKWRILQKEDREFEEPIKIEINDKILNLFPITMLRRRK